MVGPPSTVAVACSSVIVVPCTDTVVTVLVDNVLVAVMVSTVVACALLVAVINEVEDTVTVAVFVTHGFAVSMQEHAVLTNAEASELSFDNRLA